MALQAKGRAAVARMVTEMEEIRCDNLSGRWGWIERGSFRGTIPKGDHFYVIYSYKTPIAWWDGQRWTMPPETYSRTTSNHQSTIRVAIARAQEEVTR